MRLLLLTLFSLLSFGAYAEQRIEHLYEARVPLIDNSPAGQQAAILQGMQRVLNKISGYSGTADFPELQAVVGDASEMVSEFAIQAMSQPASDGISAQNTEGLYMRFVQNGIDQIVRQYEIPVWPAVRPEVLVLLVSDFAGQPELLTKENYPAAYAVLEQIAFDRGINLTLLNQEQVDSYLVSSASVWNLDELAMQATFALLPTDAIAVIRIEVENEFGSKSTFSGDISLINSDLDYSQRLEDSSVTGLVFEAMNSYIDELSLQTAFVVNEATGGNILLEVKGVPSFTDFARIRDYLVDLEQVESLKLLRLDEEGIVFQLSFQSGLALLQASLNSSGFLIDDNASFNSSSSSSSNIENTNQLNYRYPVSLGINGNQVTN